MDVVDYFNKGLDVVPVKGKRPFVTNWYEVDFSERIGWYKWDGVGLKCGKASRVIALDFDSTDAGVIEEIRKLLPPVFSGKIGNPNKLPTMFFSWNGEESRDWTGIEVQLLSTGKQTVLPDSPHPDFDKFVWCGKSLLEIDIDDLPVLREELVSSLEALDLRFKGLEGGRAGANKGGRNNALKRQATAALIKGVGVEQVTREVLEYDRTQHLIPLFEDVDEGMGSNAEVNASRFVISIANSLARAGKLNVIKNEEGVKNGFGNVVVGNSVRVGGEDNTRADSGDGDIHTGGDDVGGIGSGISNVEYRKLPRLEGLGQDIFNELYLGAPVPRSQFAFMNALSVMSLVAANKAMYVGTGLNCYLYGVAPSAAGKDYPFKRSQKLLHAAGLGGVVRSLTPTSESSILRLIDDNRVAGFYINEAEKLLKVIGSVRSNFGVIETLTDLYDAPGSHFVSKSIIGKDGRLDTFGGAFSPYGVITMLSTHRAFEEYCKTEMFDTGFLSRFDLFFEDRKKHQQWVEQYNPPITQSVADRLMAVAKCGEMPLVDDSRSLIEIPDLVVNKPAMRRRKEIFNEVVNTEIEDTRFNGLMNRRLYKANKYCGLHHFMVNEADALTTPVSVKSVEWGWACSEAVTSNMMPNIGYSVADNSYEREVNRMIRFIEKRQHKGKTTKKKDISAGLKGCRIMRNRIQDDLFDRGVLIRDKDRNLWVKI